MPAAPNKEAYKEVLKLIRKRYADLNLAFEGISTIEADTISKMIWNSIKPQEIADKILSNRLK